MKTGAYEEVLGPVIATAGVRGALVVVVRDGLVVDGRVHVGIHGEAVAALAASLYRRAGRAAGGNGSRAVRFVELEAGEGRILMAGGGDLVLLAVLDQRANPGQARLAVRRAAEALRGETESG